MTGSEELFDSQKNPVHEGKDFDPGGVHLIAVLCLDTSGSMRAKDPTSGLTSIELVRKYAAEFMNTDRLSTFDKDKIELCIITFGSQVTLYQDFAPMSSCNKDFSDLKEDGYTATYSALIAAVAKAKERRDALKMAGEECFRPIIFIVTDGWPANDDSNRENCLKLLARYMDPDENGKVKMNLIICGMPGCDMSIMDGLCKQKTLISLENADAVGKFFNEVMVGTLASIYRPWFDDDNITSSIRDYTDLLVLGGQDAVSPD